MAEMNEHCPTCGSTCSIEGETTLHYEPDTSERGGYVPYETTLHALLREALDDQYAQHAPGCNAPFSHGCKCGYRDWRKRAAEAIR